MIQPKLGAIAGRGQRIKNYENAFGAKCVDTMGRVDAPLPLPNVMQMGNACLQQIRQSLKMGVSMVHITISDINVREYVEANLTEAERSQTEIG